MKLTKEQREYKKSHPQCEACLQPATDLHHADHDRRTDNPENWISLCRGCHHYIHFVSEVLWIELFGYQNDPRFKKRYDNAKFRKEQRNGSVYDG